jgi:integrase
MGSLDASFSRSSQSRHSRAPVGNEILALRWSDFDVERKTLRIERAIEQTKAHGRRLKEPKTARGRRTIAVDDGLVELLRGERARHLRISAGVPDDAPVDLSLIILPEGALMFPSPLIRTGILITASYAIRAT